MGIESKPLIDLYLDVEKFAKENGEKIIYVDLRDAYPDSGMPAFTNVKGKDIVIGLHPDNAIDWHLAHELVHVLVNYKFYCRIIAEDNKNLKEKYETMFNIVLDIPVNRIVRKRRLDVSELVRWNIERSITPRLEREIKYDSWDRFIHYIVNFFDFELFSNDSRLDTYLRQAYAKSRKLYQQEFERDVSLAKHVSRLIWKFGFTSLEKFDRCLIAIFQDERFREEYDIPEVEIEPDFPEEYKRSAGGAAGF